MQKADMDSKTLTLRWLDELWNKRNGAAISEMMAPDAIGHTEGGTTTGPVEFEERMYKPLMAAFPQMKLSVEGTMTEGDGTVVRWTVEATHGGEFAGIAATARRVRFSGMTWLRFVDGKLVEGWDRWNLHGLLGLLQTGVSTATATLNTQLTTLN
jgi:predicted ester cyclase